MVSQAIQTSRTGTGFQVKGSTSSPSISQRMQETGPTTQVVQQTPEPVMQAAAAAPPREERKSAYDHDELDVPAFMRKRGDV